MGYKTQIAKVRKKIKGFRALAESNGWKTGHHISEYITKNQLWDYARLLGKEEGMMQCRKITLDEIRLSHSKGKKEE